MTTESILNGILSQLKALNEKIDEQNEKLDYISDVLDDVASIVDEENDIASCLLDSMFHADHEDTNTDIIVEDEDDFEDDECVDDFEDDESNDFEDEDCSKCDVEDCEYRREPYEDDEEEEETEAVADYRESLLDVAERLLEILKG